MKKKRPCELVIACLALALSGCGAPFFVSEADLRNVLGKEYLYAASSLGIDAFEFDVETGRITKLAGSPFGAGCTFGLASVLGGTALYGLPFMYDDVYGYRIEQAGTLTVLPGFPYDPTDVASTLISPTAGIVSPDGRFAHIVHSSTAGGVSSYAVDQETAALTYLGSTLGVACTPIAIAVDAGGSNLYLSTTLPASIVHFRVEDGLPGTQTAVASPPSSIRRLVAHPRGYLYGITSSGSDQNIFGYQIDSASGTLTALSGSPYRLGFGPTNIGGVTVAIDRSGEWLYATATDQRLYSYRIDADTGALTVAQGLGTANSAKVATSSSGRYVFAGGDMSGGAGSIRVYQVGSDGSLGEIAGSPFAQTSGLIYAMMAVNTGRLP